MPKMTADQFCESDGGVCPLCGSDDITYTDLIMESSTLGVYCSTCGETYYEVYKLVGYMHDQKMHLREE